MNKISMALMMGSSTFIKLPPVSTWWMDLVDNASYYYQHCFDSNNNYFSTLTASNGLTVDITKVSDTATLIQKYTIGTSTNARVFNYIGTDTAGNFYIAGTVYGFPSTYVHVAKYNSSMVKQWEKTIQPSTGENVAIRALFVDASSNVCLLYVMSDSNGLGSMVLSKFDSSGTVLFHRKVTATGSGVDSYCELSVGSDSSNATYIAFNDTAANSGLNGYVVKYTSTGTLSWQRKFTSTYGGMVSGLAVTPSGDVYVTREVVNVSSGSQSSLIKLNTSGTLQWTRWYSPDSYGVGNNTYVTLDATGNIYWTFQSITDEKIVFKLDSTGATTYSRLAAISAMSPVALSPNGHMALVSVFLGYTLKVPSDGSKANATYGGNSYTSVSYTLQTTANTTVATTTDLTVTTPTMTVTNTTLNTITGPTTITPNFGYVR